MSYTLTAIKHLVKDSPVISSDFANLKTDHNEKPMEEAQGDEEGEGLNQLMRDVLEAREKDGRHLFMHKALKKWLSMPYSVRGMTRESILMGRLHAGVINAAVAENRLMDDLTSTVMQIPTMNKYKTDVAHYFDLRGTPALRKALAKFLTLQLEVEPDTPLNPDLMTVTNGAGPGMEVLVSILTEPGYSWMSPTPHCKQLEYNLTIRGGPPMIPIPLTSRIDGGATLPFELTIRKVKIAYKLAMQRGKKIAGIILCNPNNPLGCIYSKNLLKEILVFANEVGLHVIFDEVYALSMHEDVQFHSVASFSYLPNPMTTHFVWSCSKDLALSGFRCGVLYSWNPYVNKTLGLLSQFMAVPMPVQDKIETYLRTQAQFLDEVFIPYNQMRLQRAKDLLSERLEIEDIKVHPCDAGLYLWCNVNRHLKEQTFDEELDLCEKMLLVGLWVVPGRLLDSVEPGWIRINFASKQDTWDEFFKRWPKALEKYHTNDDDDIAGRFSPDHSDDEESGRQSSIPEQEAWWNTASVMKMLEDSESELEWNEAAMRIDELRFPPRDLSQDASKLPLTGSFLPDKNASKHPFNFDSVIIPSYSSVTQYHNLEVEWSHPVRQSSAMKRRTMDTDKSYIPAQSSDNAASWGMKSFTSDQLAVEQVPESKNMVTVITGYEESAQSGPRSKQNENSSKRVSASNDYVTPSEKRRLARLKGKTMKNTALSPFDGGYQPNEDVLKTYV